MRGECPWSGRCPDEAASVGQVVPGAAPPAAVTFASSSNGHHHSAPLPAPSKTNFPLTTLKGNVVSNGSARKPLCARARSPQRFRSFQPQAVPVTRHGFRGGNRAVCARRRTLWRRRQHPPGPGGFWRICRGVGGFWRIYRITSGFRRTYRVINGFWRGRHSGNGSWPQRHDARRFGARPPPCEHLGRQLPSQLSRNRDRARGTVCWPHHD